MWYSDTVRLPILNDSDSGYSFRNRYNEPGYRSFLRGFHKFNGTLFMPVSVISMVIDKPDMAAGFWNFECDKWI